jgi:hypothetical protein
MDAAPRSKFFSIEQYQGLPGQAAENAWLELDPTDEADAMPHILGSSVSYRIAVGPQQGRIGIKPADCP